MRTTSVVAFIISLIGAVNWLFIGLFNFNLVSFICGDNTVIERIIYSLVGLAGLWMIFFSFIYKPFNNAK